MEPPAPEPVTKPVAQQVAEPLAEPPAEPVDWAFAAQVATRLAGRDATAVSYLSASLEPDFAEATARAENLVGELTGLRALDGEQARASVVSRQTWVSANVMSFQRMLEPLTRRASERLTVGPLASVGRRVAGAEMGVLLGLVSHRVLGQYDLLLPDGNDPLPGGSEDAASGDGDVIYYVGPNVLALEKRFDFRPRDFRLWLALHEVTHRAQFTGVPWMKQHFRSLVDRLLGLSEPDPQRLVNALRHAVDELLHGRGPVGEAGLVGLLASTEQKAVLDEVQALMSLLEGHGNVVMDRLGREHVAGQERMSRTLATRRNAGGMGRHVQRLMGLDMKLRQYEVGERFIDGVVDRAGFGAIDAAWSGPDQIPTLAELDDPSAWLARVGVKSTVGVG